MVAYQTNGEPLNRHQGSHLKDQGWGLGGVPDVRTAGPMRGEAMKRHLMHLRLRTQAEQAGTLTLRLMRGKKVYSRLTVGLAPGETTQRLRLPRGLKRGTYTVKIAFKAAGAGYTATSAAKVVLRK